MRAPWQTRKYTPYLDEEKQVEDEGGKKVRDGDRRPRVEGKRNTDA
jgi:hypothetical protein